MGRTLIVANQTLGGAELDRTIRERIAGGQRDYYIVVPMIAARYETSVWTLGFPLEGLPDAAAAEIASEEGQRRDDAIAESQARAEERLARMITSVHEAGGRAAGEVGDPDPGLAVRELLEREHFDEVLVSTLPPGISRWLRMDLPSRVQRMTDVPVTTVEAEPEPSDDDPPTTAPERP